MRLIGKLIGLLGVVALGVLGNWMADGLDPLCGAKRCSARVTPYAVTFYTDHAVPWAQAFWRDEILRPILWWQNDDNQTFALVALLTGLFGMFVAFWSMTAKKDRRCHLVGGFAILLAAMITSLVRVSSKVPIQVEDPNRWLVFALSGLVVWLALKVTALSVRAVAGLRV